MLCYVNTVKPVWSDQGCRTKNAKFGQFWWHNLYKSCLFYLWPATTCLERPPWRAVAPDRFHCICIWRNINGDMQLYTIYMFWQLIPWRRMDTGYMWSQNVHLYNLNAFLTDPWLLGELLSIKNKYILSFLRSYSRCMYCRTQYTFPIPGTF